MTLKQTKNPIVFLSSPLTLYERYSDFSLSGAIEIPIGLCYLASMTRKYNYPTSIIDAEALHLNIDTIIERLKDIKPKYIGITSSTVGIENSQKLALKIKQCFSNITIILGGNHLTALPTQTLESCPSFDIGVIGEGEETIIEILDCLENGNNLNNISGIAFRKNGKVIITKPRSFIKDLDILPFPAWDLLPDISKYYRMPSQSTRRTPGISSVTSRGCPFKCIFCDRKVFGNSVRSHSAEYVLKMIKTLKNKMHIKEIHFEDDIFTLYPKRLKEICDALIQQKIKISWSCFSRVDSPFDIDLLKLMKKAGCWQIKYGVESGAQSVLDISQKGVTKNQVITAVKLAKKAKLKVKGFFIIGLPGETKKTLEETLNFMKNVPFDDISLPYFTPYPGTDIFDNKKLYQKYGKFHFSNWKELNSFIPVFIPNNMNVKDLQYYHKKILKAFFLRPKIFIT